MSSCINTQEKVLIMNRKQFTFYESFFLAISRIRNKEDRADAYDSICQYALYGTEPDLESMPDTVAIAFELSKPNMDSSRKKAMNGKKGGSKQKAKGKQTESKMQEAKEKQTQSNGTQANINQTESKKENEKEVEVEVEVEKESLYIPTPLTGGRDICPPAAAAVFTAYMDRINSTPSPTSMEELAGYVKALGEAVCLRAIDKAIDAGKPTWNYIRGILRNLEASGVKCLADWERRDAEHQGAVKQARGAGGPVDGPNVSLDDVDRMVQAAQWAAEQGGEK